MVTPIYLSDTTAIYDRLTARAFLAENPHKTFLLNIVTKPIHYV